jgi:hypothetical protein
MKKIDKKRVKEILKDINDKDSFTIELISAVNKSISRNDPKLVRECLDEWEASAELNRIPGFSKKVRIRFNSLVKAGLIK